MDNTILVGESALAVGKLFAADADGNPKGNPISPDAPLSYEIADSTIATFSLDANDNAIVVGLAEGVTTIKAMGTTGGVVATPRAGTITVTQTVDGKFVTTIEWQELAAGA